MKPSPPRAPDYAGAATSQGAANVETARAQSRLSNPNMVSPLGTRSVLPNVTIDPDTGERRVSDGDAVTIVENLSPAGQKLFDTNMQTQLGLGNLANQGISQVQGAMGQPFNPQLPNQMQSLGQGQFQGGPTPTTNGTPGAQQYTQDTTRAPNGGSIQGGVDTSPLQQMNRGVYDTAQVQYGTGYNAPIQQGLGDAGGIQRGFGDVGNNQRGLDFSGAPNLPSASFGGENDPVTQAIVQRNQPFMDRARSMRETELTNQGIPLGSEAWGNAQADLGRQENDFRLGAIEAGARQQQALFGQGLQARQQGVGEITQQGQFGNQAQGQAFQQAAMRGDFGNAAQQQAFAQNLASGTFGNQAQQQGYNQSLGNANLFNQAQGQAFQQGMANAGLNNAALQNQFAGNLAAGQFGNQAQQQGYQQDLSGRNIDLQAEQQAYQQQMGLANLGLGAQQQQFGQQLQSGQMNNQAEQARLAQQQSAGTFQNQARQQALSEQAYLRSLPMNEVAALMSGSQVQMPQFQGFSGANIGQTPIFNAAQAQGQNSADLYNARVGQQNAMMGGLFGLGAAGIMASDRRLKSNIKRIGTHPLGIGIYEYDIFGRRERGVMADEVLTVRPDAVLTHPSGYMMVDYAQL